MQKLWHITPHAILKSSISIKMPKFIDLTIDENFMEKNPYFFTYFTCKFVGFAKDIQKALEITMIEMGAKIADADSDDVPYIFTDHYYYSTLNVQKNKRYYSISYISHCIRAHERLKIKNYRYRELEGTTVRLECNCPDIRTILKEKFTNLDNFNNVKCSLCRDSATVVQDAIKDKLDVYCCSPLIDKTILKSEVIIPKSEVIIPESEVMILESEVMILE